VSISRRQRQSSKRHRGPAGRHVLSCGQWQSPTTRLTCRWTGGACSPRSNAAGGGTVNNVSMQTSTI